MLSTKWRGPLTTGGTRRQPQLLTHFRYSDHSGPDRRGSGPISGANRIYPHLLCSLNTVQHSVKNYDAHKKEKAKDIHDLVKKQSTELDPEMTQILELPDFEISMINVLKG